MKVHRFQKEVPFETFTLNLSLFYEDNSSAFIFVDLFAAQRRPIFLFC